MFGDPPEDVARHVGWTPVATAEHYSQTGIVISSDAVASAQPPVNQNFGSPDYSAYAVCTKTIIHLSVGESGGYLPRRLAAW